MKNKPISAFNFKVLLFPVCVYCVCVRRIISYSLTSNDTNTSNGRITSFIRCTLTFQTTVFSIVTIRAGGGAVVPIGARGTS